MHRQVFGFDNPWYNKSVSKLTVYIVDCLHLFFYNKRRNGLTYSPLDFASAIKSVSHSLFLLYRNLRRNSFARWDVYEIVLATRVQAQPAFLVSN